MNPIKYKIRNPIWDTLVYNQVSIPVYNQVYIQVFNRVSIQVSRQVLNQVINITK
jgi:hypothetical protein